MKFHMNTEIKSFKFNRDIIKLLFNVLNESFKVKRITRKN